MADEANPMSFRFRKSGAIIGFTMREQNDIAREVAKDTADFWYENYLDRHFTPSGSKFYGYEPRQGERMERGEKGFWKTYTGRKVRQKGHRNPLMWSGNSYDWLKLRRRYQITATGGQARARILLGAPAFNFRNPNSKVDMQKDITTVHPTEKVAMLEVVKRRFIELYSARRAALK